MASYPSFSYKRNLEPLGEELRVGGWRISVLIDPVSEKRFVLFQLKGRASRQLLPSVLAFRSQTATIMAPTHCLETVSETIEGDSIEFLTDYVDVITPDKVIAEEIPQLLDTVFKTLGRFDRFRFQCGDLYLQALGRRSDGNYCLLPNAYILPYFFGEGAPSTGLRIELKMNPRALDPTLGTDDGIVHATLTQKLLTNILDTVDISTADNALLSRLSETVDGISRGEILDVGDAYRSVFGRDLGGEPVARSRTALNAPDEPSIERYVDETLDRAAVEGSVTLIKGDSYTGKSRIIRKAFALLDRSDRFRAVPLDEWDLFTNAWKKTTRDKKSQVHNVWLIDDIDEKALAYSDFSRAMLESKTVPLGSVVMSTRSAGVVGESERFIARLRDARGSRYHEIATEPKTPDGEASRLAAYLQAAIVDVGGKEQSPGAPADLVKVFLDRLKPTERQLLEFMAVARFAMPLDLVMTVLSEPDSDMCATILRLAELNCLELVYRRAQPKEVLSLFLRVESTALRRLIYDNTSAQRQKKLHRTVAMLGEQHDTFPKYMLLFHAIQSRNDELAARHVVAYLKETKAGQRHPFIVSLCVDLTGDGELETLSMADRVLVNHELSIELLEDNRGDDAEKLLGQSLRLIDGTREDEMLKNAPRLSVTLRLLADRWEARGEFKRALGLLEEARSNLQSALAMPDQAQLLNDVGWLQYRLGDYQKSMESCRLSLNTLSANQYPLIVAQALNLMGVVHFNTSRYDEAISYYEQAAFLRERAGDENALAASFNNLALAYQSKSDFEKAFVYHNKSLTLKERQNNKAGIAAGYLNLAFLHLEARNFREAEEKCRESLAICEELGNAQLTADNYTTLGDIALEDGDFEKAEQHYQESRRISHQREAINEEMGALRRLSSLCIKLERFDEAREYADAAFRLVRRIGSRYEEAQIEVILAELELNRNETAEALKLFDKAAAQFTTLSKYRLAATVLSKSGLIHTRAGNNIEAQNALDRAHEYVRADIGRELPEEFVELQQALRVQPTDSPVKTGGSQRLIMVFNDVSALTDSAADPYEFIRRALEVSSRVADAVDCNLALKVGKGRFVLFDQSGSSSPLVTRNMEDLFSRTLKASAVLDSRSPDASSASDAAQKGNPLVSVPLRAMSDDLGCLLFYIDDKRLPLSSEDANFFRCLGRQIAGSFKLMLQLNDGFIKTVSPTPEKATKEPAQKEYQAENLIGKSEAMKTIFRTLEKVRNADTGILILGESGTGKSALASVIHSNSPRRNHPFLEIHCAQIPHNLLESELFGHERGSFTGAVRRKIGLCEVSNGGTLFLDDINVMPVETQTKLLHFIESKSYMRLGGTQKLRADVRIVAASNENLETLCREGKFREDLYYRLKVIMIELPPLRERADDTAAIALDYVKRSCAQKGIPPRTLSLETMQLLKKAPWRGNVRELQNVLERVVVLSDDQVITPSSLPEDFLKEVTGTSRQSHERLDELVDEIIRLGNYSEAKPLLPALEALLASRMVSHVDGKARAASMLGISKPTLYARLRDFDKMS